MVTIPCSFTECEEYRGFTIATRSGFYAGFGEHADTRNYSTRSEVRRAIDSMLDHGEQT